MHCVRYRTHFVTDQLTSVPMVVSSSSNRLFIAVRKKVGVLMSVIAARRDAL